MTKLHILLIVLLLSTCSFAATLTSVEEGTPSKDNRIPPVEETASPVKATTSSVDDGISPVDGSSHRALFLLGNDVLENIASRLTPLQKKYLEVAIKGAKLTYTKKEEKEISDKRDVLHKLREIDTEKEFDTNKEFATRLKSYLGEFIAPERVQVAMKKAAKTMKRDEIHTKYNKYDLLALHVEKQLAEFIPDPSKFEQAVRDAKRQTWLMKAVVKNKLCALETLLQFPPGNLKSEIGTLLNAATRQDRLTLVKELWNMVAVQGTEIPAESFLSALKCALSYFDWNCESECLLFLMRVKRMDKDSIKFTFPDVQPPSWIQMLLNRDEDSSQLVKSVNDYVGSGCFYRLHYREGIFYCTDKGLQTLPHVI